METHVPKTIEILEAEMNKTKNRILELKRDFPDSYENDVKMLRNQVSMYKKIIDSLRKNNEKYLRDNGLIE